MTDKELHKLGRRDLLQLMLAQGREAEKAKGELAETQDKLTQLEAGYERLKRRLDEKDALIHKLRASLKNARGSAPEVEPSLTSAPAPSVPVQEEAPVAQALPVAQATPVVESSSTPVVEPLPVPKEPEPPQRQARTEASRKQERRQEKPPAYDPATENILPPAKSAEREQNFYDYLFGPVVEREQPEARPQPPTADPPPATRAASQDEQAPVPQAQPSDAAPPDSRTTPQNEQIPVSVPAQPFPVYGEHIPVYERTPVPLAYPQRVYAAPQPGYYYAAPAGEARPYYPGPGQTEPAWYQPPMVRQEAAGGEPIYYQQPAPPERYGYPYDAPVAHEPQPWYPPQSRDGFLPESEPVRKPEGMQALSAIEFVNGKAVSRSQVLRPKR